MKIFSLSLMLFWGCALLATGQQQTVLSARYEGKIKRADKKIGKGDAIVDKTQKYTTQMEQIEQQGNNRKGKIRRLEKKSNKIIITSASYYKEGYAKKYSTYKKGVAKGLKDGRIHQDAQSLMYEAKADYKNGRKLRRKSANYSNVHKAAAMLLEANEAEARAIDNLEQVIEQYKVDANHNEPAGETEYEAIVANTDTLAVLPLINAAGQDSVAIQSILVDSTFAVNEVSIADSLGMHNPVLASDTIMPLVTAEPLNPSPVVEDITTVPMPKLYFTVQFLAEKKSVAPERLSALYDGPFEVVQHRADGWFRYSFGRFVSQEEANLMKTRSGIEGYVVAYYNEERISTRAAAEMLAQ